MDDVESSELVVEGLDRDPDLNPSKVKFILQYKSGSMSELELDLPIESPIYDIPLDYYALLELITSSCSFGESPVVALPLGKGNYLFVDLSATEFTELVVLDDGSGGSTEAAPIQE